MLSDVRPSGLVQNILTYSGSGWLLLNTVRVVKDCCVHKQGNMNPLICYMEQKLGVFAQNESVCFIKSNWLHRERYAFDRPEILRITSVKDSRKVFRILITATLHRIITLLTVTWSLFICWRTSDYILTQIVQAGNIAPTRLFIQHWIWSHKSVCLQKHRYARTIRQ